MISYIFSRNAKPFLQLLPEAQPQTLKTTTLVDNSICCDATPLIFRLRGFHQVGSTFLVFHQIREIKNLAKKVVFGLLGSFWKCQKWIQGTFLPGSYTAIFSQLSFFIEIFSGQTVSLEKPGFSMVFHWFSLLGPLMNVYFL